MSRTPRYGSLTYIAADGYLDGSGKPIGIGVGICEEKSIVGIISYNYAGKAVTSLDNIFTPFCSEEFDDEDIYVNLTLPRMPGIFPASGTRYVHRTVDNTGGITESEYYLSFREAVSGIPGVLGSGTVVSPNVFSYYSTAGNTDNTSGVLGRGTLWYASGQHYRPEVTAYNSIKFNGPITPTVGENPDSDTITQVIEGRRFQERIRSVGLSTPGYIAGWGYTANGRPTPSVYDWFKKQNANYIDIAERSGTFLDFSYPIGVSPTASGDYHTSFVIKMIRARKFIDDLKNTFHEDFQKDQASWKAGNLSVSWDDDRRVWYSGPEIREGYCKYDVDAALGRLAGSGSFTSGILILYDGKYDGWRKVEEDKEILFIHRSSAFSIQSGAYMQIMRMPNGEYRPIWADCNADPSGAPASFNRSVSWGVL